MLRSMTDVPTPLAASCLESWEDNLEKHKARRGIIANIYNVRSDYTTVLKIPTPAATMMMQLSKECCSTITTHHDHCKNNANSSNDVNWHHLTSPSEPVTIHRDAQRRPIHSTIQYT
jgi:hypothetical protein